MLTNLTLGQQELSYVNQRCAEEGPKANSEPIAIHKVRA